MHIIVNLILALWIWIILCFSKVCVRNVRNCVNGFACVKWIMLKFSVKLLSLLLRLMLGSKEGCVNKGFVWFCGWWQAVKGSVPQVPSWALQRLLPVKHHLQPGAPVPSPWQVTKKMVLDIKVGWAKVPLWGLQNWNKYALTLVRLNHPLKGGKT